MPHDHAQLFSDRTRLPAWRYLQAKRAVSSGRILVASRVDALTAKLASYLREESECPNEAVRRRIQRKYNPLAAAVEMYRDGLGASSCYIESLILAREPTSEIAKRMAVSPEVIACYRSCFFSVGAHLDDREYILRCAIWSRQRCRADFARRQAAMKLIAYCCGADALNVFLLSNDATHREKWQAPAALMEQIAAIADWNLVLDFAHSQENGAQRNFTIVREYWEQIINRATANRASANPTNMLERMAQRMS